jgi:hypothetical protein
MPRYEVRYQVFKDDKKQSYAGGYLSYTTVVEAANPNQAQRMVENQNGGPARCRTFGGKPV